MNIDERDYDDHACDDDNVENVDVGVVVMTLKVMIPRDIKDKLHWSIGTIWNLNSLTICIPTCVVCIYLLTVFINFARVYRETSKSFC